MLSLKKFAALLALCLMTATANAQVYGNTNTYSGLSWGFSSGQAGFTSCSTLFLDATGDFSNSSNYVLYGDLSCSGGSYFSNGNAFFDGFGNFNLSVEIGVAHKLVCVGLNGSTLSGSCTIYNNSGVVTGSATITF